MCLLKCVSVSLQSCFSFTVDVLYFILRIVCFIWIVGYVGFFSFFFSRSFVLEISDVYARCGPL